MRPFAEQLGPAGRVEAEHQADAVEVEHLGVVRDQAPGGALHPGEGSEHLGPHPTDRVDVQRSWRHRRGRRQFGCGWSSGRRRDRRPGGSASGSAGGLDLGPGVVCRRGDGRRRGGPRGRARGDRPVRRASLGDLGGLGDRSQGRPWHRHPDSPLQLVEPGPQAALGVVGGGQQQPGAEQLDLQPGRGGPGHLGQRGVHHVSGPAQPTGAEPLRLPLHPLQLVLRGRAQHRVRSLAGRCHHQQVSQPLEQILDEPARIVPGLDHPVDHGEHAGAVSGGERVDHVVEQRAVGVAEQ